MKRGNGNGKGPNEVRYLLVVRRALDLPAADRVTQLEQQPLLIAVLFPIEDC